MMVPVRCFSCGLVVGEYYEKFEEAVKKKKNPEEILDELGIEKYCCRRMILSHVNLYDKINEFDVRR